MRRWTIVIGLLFAVAGCKKGETPAKKAAEPLKKAEPKKAAEPTKKAAEPAAPMAKATPPVPAHWKLIADKRFANAAFEAVAKRLGGKITALRNIDYQARGGSVRLNVITAASAADADKIVAALKKMKSEDAFWRKDLAIYELVGKNEVLAEIKAAKALLQSKLGAKEPMH